ncbi:MAG: 5-(carboxyamino)imidazole ribonucleotide synthase [Actinomycetes bacterium]
MLRTVGIIGGGQLARMMIVPALELGFEVKVLAEAEKSPAKLAATVGDYTDLRTVREFAKTVDVITFDHEHVPLQILESLIAEGVNVQPSPKALLFAQNKLAMRKRLAELKVPIPGWAEVITAEDVDAFIAAHDGVAVLKTATGGYDGKGVRVIRSARDAEDWLAEGKALLIEEKVDFVRELAQLSARNSSGQWLAWPVVQTIQQDGVCAEVHSPADNADSERAAKIAEVIATGLGITGVLAVELFETADGKLLVNELAMRPHNSGHFTIDGSVTSQFEQHLRAVLDLPLGSTEGTSAYAVMLNLLGPKTANTFAEHFEKAWVLENTSHIHLYGKEYRAGRKMGHITALSSVSLVDARAQALATYNALLA